MESGRSGRHLAKKLECRVGILSEPGSSAFKCMQAMKSDCVGAQFCIALGVSRGGGSKGQTI